MLKLAIIVSIIAQALSAPSGCLDLCGPPSTLHSSNEALRDLHNLTDELKRDSDRPGNWTEYNDYKTSDGAGNVHEERGQVVKGNSKMRYYKKNYAASYGSGSRLYDTNLRNDDSLLLQQTNLLNSQNSNRQNSNNERYQQSGRSSKIEDYNGRIDTSSDHVNTGVNEHVDSDNWNRHNSYITDGGHGRVHEEEGQYTHGPAKVHYYKKNYTSSFSSSGASPVIPLPDISTDLYTQTHNLQKQLEEISREVHRGHQSQTSQNTNRYETQYQSTGDNESRHNQRIESDVHQRYPSPVTGKREEHYEQHSSREHRVQSHGSYVPSQTNYVIPDQIQTSESQQHYQQEIYKPPSQVIPQTSQTSQTYQTQGHQYQTQGQEYQSQAQYQNQYRSQDHRSSDGLVHVPLSSGNSYNSNRDNSRIYSHQQVRDHSELSQSYLDNDRNRQNVYGQHDRQQQISSQSGKRVEEHWNSSGRRVEESYPQHISSSSQKLEDLETQHATRGNENSYSGSSNHGGNRYVSGSSSYHQRYESHSGGHSDQNGHFHAGVLDLGYDTPDCDTEQVGSNHQRRYKRNSEPFNEQLPQKNIDKPERKTRSTDFGQETQQFEDLTQLTQGFADYTQQQPTGYQNRNDQQQTEDSELSQQTQQVEDLTQEYENHGQQQQNQGYGSYGQQQRTSSHLGHDQQYPGNLASSSPTQQNRGSIQQTQRYGNRGQQSGQLEIGNQYQQHNIEDSQLSQQTQQVEDLTQQTQRYGGYRQQEYSGRSNQQQVGNLGLSQQTQQVEDLTQQTQRYGGYRQQEYGGRSNQQQAGSLGLSQQTQQVEDLTQQTQRYGGYQQQEYGGRSNQQQVGNLGLSQQTQQVEDLTQQTYDDYYQQHSGKIELDEHHRQHQTQHMGYDQRHQQTEDLSQQTQRFDDYHQQQSGSHRLGQNQYGQSTGIGSGQQTEDFSQHDDHYYQSQQTTAENQQNINFQGRQPAPKPVSRLHLLGSTQRSDIEPGYGSEQETKPVDSPLGVKGGRGGFQPQSSYPNQYDSPSTSVLSLEDQQFRTQREELNAHVQPLESQTQYPEFMSTTPAPGFWKKVGQKITTGFEKVKEKVNDAFG